MNAPDNTAASGSRSVGQTVTIRSRQYDVRHVDDEGASTHGSTPTTDRIHGTTNGLRERTGRQLCRESVSAPSSAGTVTEATPDLIALTMDEPISGAEDWDNAICWSCDDAAHLPGLPIAQISAVFASAPASR